MEDAAHPRAAIYARVSTEDQIKGTSLDGQVERCRRAADAAGWHVVAGIPPKCGGIPYEEW